MKIRNGFVSNSSSSCFIVNSSYGEKVKYTCDKTTDILSTILDSYNKIFNTKLSFSEVFEKPQIITTSFVKETISGYVGDSEGKEVVDKDIIKALEKEKKKTEKENKWDFCWSLPGNDKLYVQGWKNNYNFKSIDDGRTWFELDPSKYIDKIAILSAGDNAIPSCLFDIITEKFNANRIHMG